MFGLQFVGHGTQGDMAHVFMALGAAVAQRLAVLGVQREFAVEHPGIVDFFQRQPRQGRVEQQGFILVQCLFLELASARDAITFERPLVLPQINKSGPQASHRHRPALGGHAGGAAGVSGLFLGQGIAHGHDEKLRLAGGARRQRTVDIDVRLSLGGALGLGGSINQASFSALDFYTGALVLSPGPMYTQ